MRRLEWYMLRRLAGAFVLTIGVLIAVVWVTQALRRLDLVTAHGQTIWFFLKMTLLALPSLAIVVAPFAILIGMITVLNAMIADSELVVVSGSGGSRWVVLRPFLIFAVVISVIITILALEVGPSGRRQMREMLTTVRADVIASVLRPGRFTEIDDGLTFHVADRDADGVLSGIMLADDRDSNIRFTYLGERGQVVETLGRTLLLMHDGVIQRRMIGGSLSVVAFESYAFDLTHLTGQDKQPTFRTTERGFYDLISPDPNDAFYQRVPNRFRAELHDRLVQPLFPVAFVLITFIFLGDPKTFRQGRGLAIAGAVLGCLLVRVGSFAAINISSKSAGAIPFVYLIPAAAIVLSTLLIRSDRQVGVPDTVTRAAERLVDWAKARFDRDQLGPGPQAPV